MTARWNIYKRIALLEKHLTPEEEKPVKVRLRQIIVGTAGLLLIVAALVFAGLGAYKTIPLVTAAVVLFSALIGLLIAVARLWKKSSVDAGDWNFVGAFAAPAVIAALLVGAEWGAYLDASEEAPSPSTSPAEPAKTPAL